MVRLHHVLLLVISLVMVSALPVPFSDDYERRELGDVQYGREFFDEQNTFATREDLDHETREPHSSDPKSPHPYTVGSTHGTTHHPSNHRTGRKNLASMGMKAWNGLTGMTGLVNDATSIYSNLQPKTQ